MSEIKKTIAILRGGQQDTYRSFQNGARAILALAKYPERIKVIDVSLDKNNHWFERGIPSDPHKTFSKADFYLDFTDNEQAPYHLLAKKLKVKWLFQNNYLNNLNRINVNRILEQLQIETPKYKVIRQPQNLELELKNIWEKFQMPIVIKEAKHKFNLPSLLTYSFLEALAKTRDILDKGGEVLVEEYLKGKYISAATFPKYRGQEVYVSIPVEMLNFNPLSQNLNSQSQKQVCLIGHDCKKQSLIFVEDKTKQAILELIKNIQKTMVFNQYSMVDLVLVENKLSAKEKYTLKVLDIHTSPNLFEDSRFDFILKNSGIDLGYFILESIDKMEKLENSDLF